MEIRNEEAVIGTLLGSAVGDALGLAMEGLSRHRQLKLYPRIKGYHLLFGKGMVSDDTEHACLAAQALAESGGEETLFAKGLAWKFRKWLLCLPPGIGLATLRAIVKLWLGFPATKSGVFSAGNGPAMRSAVIGVCFGGDHARLRSLVRISTRITHTDPKAEVGALAVAHAAYMAGMKEEDPIAYLNRVACFSDQDSGEFLRILQMAAESVACGRSTEDFAARLGLENGVSGFMYHTVPVALHAWFRYPRDLYAALIEAVRCGGDTDTVASILGGIVGAAVGKTGIPPNLLTHLWGWPLTVHRIESLGKCLSALVSQSQSASLPRFPFGRLFLRNLIFLPLVLAIGFRRLLPPY